MGGCYHQAGKDGVNWSEILSGGEAMWGKAGKSSPVVPQHEGNHVPMVPQRLADEGSWMEPWLGSAGPANLSSLHPPFQGSMAWGGEGAVLLLLPGTPA